MTVPEAKRLKEPETKNTRLKKLLAGSMLEIEITGEALQKKSDGRTGAAGTRERPTRLNASEHSLYAEAALLIDMMREQFMEARDRGRSRT